MSKTYLLSALSVVLSSLVFGQNVGINTQNPQAILHVDGDRDNAATGAPSLAQQSNDVVITSAGSIGIGTVSPTTRLDINNGTTNGAVKIVDGTQGAGKVLVSDADGLATWGTSKVRVITGVVTSNLVSYATSSGGKYMESYITLPKGKWLIYTGILIHGATAANTAYASRLTYSSSTTSPTTYTGFIYPTINKRMLAFTSNGTAGFIQHGLYSLGILQVEVTADTVTLYLWDHDSYTLGTTSTLTLGGSGEDYIYAIEHQ
ncbi:hypothetical protein JI747_001885 [Chryseobacterium sp. RG1]|uniref:C1q domain-containing protein n=1 Tax=Chryseobacterium tagetis TaxID=2801334 RepID=A0ABS7ZVZ8_9FLAO|nr:hypothetical protein [Chryseobacterium tagetis]MCA6065909.1 hypothetical protein [Chryseobacterium tagetis]